MNRLGDRVERITNAGSGRIDLSVRLRKTRAGIAYYLVSRRGAVKLAIAMGADFVVLALSMAFSIAMTHPLPTHFSAHDAVRILVAPLPTIACLWALGAYRVVVRFIGIEFIERCLLAMLVASVLLHSLPAVSNLAVSWHTSLTYIFVGFVALVTLRRSMSKFLQPFLKKNEVSNVVIYGAGDAGAQLAAALFVNSHFRPMAFVDDRPDLWGRTIHGLRVYSRDQLAELKLQQKFELVLLAIPSASRSRQRRILEALEPLAIKVMVMPGMEDLVNGSKRIDDLREVQIEDILDRDPVEPIESLLDQCIRGKSVMVTGAGGSIGSELCRQIARCGASRLVLFESSEFALYSIERELKLDRGGRTCEVVPVLANVLDREAVGRALSEHRVQTVYHAAAYKHVPLVESNVISAVKNNVLGTLNVVDEAVSNGISNFVLISTDKAVRPANVMGATKRVCELIVQARALCHPDIRMTMVRFGNVLASSGSVVPLFKSQIQMGGPVTVTHPEVTRYFMTIPEAASLVIQAGSMGAHGEVFVLDMGQPVKILDLARRMIHLSGLEIREPGTETGDIEVHYSGLRPGEKLYEELLISENPEGTDHPRIFKAQERFLAWELLSARIEELKQECLSCSEGRAKSILMDLVPGFRTQLAELAFDGKHQAIHPEGPAAVIH